MRLLKIAVFALILSALGLLALWGVLIWVLGGDLHDV